MCSNNIKQYRLSKNLTQEQLAKLTGLSSSYLSRLENCSSNNPTFKSMLDISKALDKSIYEIFNIKEGD